MNYGYKIIKPKHLMKMVYIPTPLGTRIKWHAIAILKALPIIIGISFAIYFKPIMVLSIAFISFTLTYLLLRLNN